MAMRLPFWHGKKFASLVMQRLCPHHDQPRRDQRSRLKHHGSQRRQVHNPWWLQRESRLWQRRMGRCDWEAWSWQLQQQRPTTPPGRDLLMTNTVFCLPTRHIPRTPWMHPHSTHWHLIDYGIIIRKKDRQDVHVTKATCGNSAKQTIASSSQNSGYASSLKDGCKAWKHQNNQAILCCLLGRTPRAHRAG